MRRCALADAGPLIALAQLDLLYLLPRLYDRVTTTPVVVAEIAPTIPVAPAWLGIAVPEPHHAAEHPIGRIDAGEYAVLLVALDARDCDVLVDDRDARLWALARGLNVIGTIGILGLAKHARLIPEIRPLLDALLARNFFLGPDLYAAALRLAGEE